MTLKKTVSIFIFALAFILNSCKKDDKTATPTPTPVDTAEYFTCKLNSVSYVDDSRFADYSSGTTRVISQNADQLIRLNINGEAVGTYNLTSSSTANAIIYIDGNGIQYNSISGSVIVTEYNKTNKIISGTFTGVLKKTTDNTQISVSEGKFNYIELLPF